MRFASPAGLIFAVVAPLLLAMHLWHRRRRRRTAVRFAELVLPPTDDRTELVNAIDSMTTAPGTAIGAAVLTSIDAISAVNPDVEPSHPIDPSNPVPQTPPGLHGYVPDIVVLLTDGTNTQGVEPYLAARQASVRRLRVYKIGFGTTTPVKMVCSAKQLGADAVRSTTTPSGSTGSDLADPAKDPAEDPQYFVIDESALHELATDTGGAYFRAQNAKQLTTVFARLPRKVELQHRQIEIGGASAAAGALLVIAAIALSSIWRRLP